MNICLDQSQRIEQNANFAKLAELLTRVKENPQAYVEDNALREVVRAVYYAELDTEEKLNLVKNLIEILEQIANASITITPFLKELVVRIIQEQNKQGLEQTPIIEAEIEGKPPKAA